MSSPTRTAPNRDAVHPFDRAYGTDTGGYFNPEALVTGQENDALNQGYSAIAPSVFREACRTWQETLADVSGKVEAYTFVDAGCGKGRALLLASEWPFRRVVGVELNRVLAGAAQRNVARWMRIRRAVRRITVVEQDVSHFRWPQAPLLVYLYNPFACSLVEKMTARLAGIANSGSGLVDLLYVNPTCSGNLASQGLFSCLWRRRIEMDAADQQADPYGTTSDLVALYRLKRRQM